jgi:UDP-N-acetylmuramyl pentapeptide phosphotransferase/UDP-N-acetylglucosamine-1-phosphate transferase
MPALQGVASLVAGSALLSVLLTWAALRYARGRALLDAPGRRRSHRRPTPRGGGIGFVLVIVSAAGWLALAGMSPARPSLALALGTALVAAIGWVDDHRSLSARLRLAVHAAAGFGLAWALQPWMAADAGRLGTMLLFVPVALWSVAAVNVWNFMDGIDGLVASQTAWVAAGLAIAFAAGGEPQWALLAACTAAAVLAFLPFNFPRAAIFMGDVGSGGLGYACGALLAVAVLSRIVSPWEAALLASGLLFDASLTLAHRLRHRRRWYTAHREHLYQWLVRSGLGHARTTMLYLGWNLLVVLPLLAVSRAWPALAPVALAAAAGLAWLLWHRTKTAMIERAWSRG